MDTLLIAVTVGSLLLAAVMSAIAWKLLREKRARKAARVEALEALAFSADLHDDSALAHCSRIAGSVYLEQGAIDEADGALRRALDAYRRAGSRRGTALTLRSIGQIGRLQRVKDNDVDYVTARDMLAELREDNLQLVSRMREAHGVCDEHGDVATASLIEVWIDEGERRVWFLYEAGRRSE